MTAVTLQKNHTPIPMDCTDNLSQVRLDSISMLWKAYITASWWHCHLTEWSPMYSEGVDLETRVHVPQDHREVCPTREQVVWLIPGRFIEGIQ